VLLITIFNVLQHAMEPLREREQSSSQQIVGSDGLKVALARHKLLKVWLTCYEGLRFKVLREEIAPKGFCGVVIKHVIHDVRSLCF
jgi:hypothetical protein